MILPLATDGGSEGGEFHAPTLAEFFPPAIFFDGTWLEMNRITLVRLLAVGVMLLLFWLALRKGTVVPGRGQSLGEIALDFVRVQIVHQLLGSKLGDRYLPMIASVFFGILAMNLTGVVPFLNIAGSAVIAVPLTFAIVAYIAFIYAGFKELGAKSIRNAIAPAGVPWPMYILLTPIEILNVFIVRPVSLSLRLLLNMMVGHLLLVLCFAATHFFFFTVQGAMGLFGVGTLVAGIIFTGVELAVAVLQAYVFALLTTAYIQQSVSTEH